MAVRITCEDANDNFKPTCGSIEELSFRPSPEVWGYFSVKSGGGIHSFSDSQVIYCFRHSFAQTAVKRLGKIARKLITSYMQADCLRSPRCLASPIISNITN